MKILIYVSSVVISFNCFAQQPLIQFWRPYDQNGILVFETDKSDTIQHEGLKLRWGGNFTQQFQSLAHINKALPVYDSEGNDLNELMNIGPGFNLATANLNLDVQLHEGIRLNLVTYLSSRHHPEAWVKGGYIQIDKMTFLNSEIINNLMKYLTIKVGHLEVNYGDFHFRRSDNGNTFYNPFVGNYIMDAFTTEIGGEVYFKYKSFLVMGGCTNGEIKGDVTNPGDRKPAYLGKIGFDKLVTDNLRIRLTSSLYNTAGSINNTLYGGDRTGSRYYLVMENNLATVSANFTSGRFNPGFRDKLTAFVINPFIKYKGFELLGNIEQAQGRSSIENKNRTFTQLAAEIVYRFGKKENIYLCGRYNQVKGKVENAGEIITIDRIQIGGGIFITKNILAKIEYVDQHYRNFPETDIRSGGRFNGIMIEGIVAF